MSYMIAADDQVVAHVTALEIDADEGDVDAGDQPFPRTIGECRERFPDGRCGFARCRLNLMVDVLPNGSLILVRPMRRVGRKQVDGEELAVLTAALPSAPAGRTGVRTIGRADRRYKRPSSAERLDRAYEALVDYWSDSGLPTCVDWWSRAAAVDVVALLGGTVSAKRRNEDGLTLEQVGKLMAVTRERARQIEVRGSVLLAPAARAAGLEPTRRLGAVSLPATVREQPSEVTVEVVAINGEIVETDIGTVCGDDSPEVAIAPQVAENA